MAKTTSQQTKRALLIGINRYALLPARYQLSGCVNDVELMARVLQENFGFSREHVVVLRDEEATREGILAALRALSEQTGGDDIVVVHFSGHGSQMTDREGDEPDGLDETIVPHDSGRAPDPNRDITDDEIYAWLRRLTEKSRLATLIFDCCHSGTVSRDAFGAMARWVEPDLRPTDQLPLSPVGAGVAPRTARDTGPSGWLPLGERYVLIAGCRDEESSYEHRTGEGDAALTHGALTYFLARELVRAEPGATYRDLFERASVMVTAAQARQHPQLEGARDREVFGVRDIAPIRSLPLVERHNGTVVLGGGAAHGVTRGARWSIYPPSQTEGGGSDQPFGVVEVQTVSALSASAEVVEEVHAGAVVAGGRAVEQVHRHPEMRLSVEIQAPANYEAQAAELARRVDESPLLRQATAGGADACAYILSPRRQVGMNDPVPQLGLLAQATWAVVGQDGRLMAPPCPVDQPDAVAALSANLERAVRYRRALSLRNPAAESVLQGRLDLTLLRRLDDGGWGPAEPEDAGGQVVFTEGDQIGFEIVNRHTAPVYVCVLDFGLAGAVEQLYPIAGAAERLSPGRAIRSGVQDGDTWELHVPETFSLATDPTDLMPHGGIETFKLLATSQPADFSVLVQHGFRGLRDVRSADTESPLVQLLAMALAGHGRRDAFRVQAAPGDEWTTVERPFLLRRRGI